MHCIGDWHWRGWRAGEWFFLKFPYTRGSDDSFYRELWKHPSFNSLRKWISQTWSIDSFRIKEWPLPQEIHILEKNFIPIYIFESSSTWNRKPWTNLKGKVYDYAGVSYQKLLWARQDFIPNNSILLSLVVSWVQAVLSSDLTWPTACICTWCVSDVCQVRDWI